MIAPGQARAVPLGQQLPKLRGLIESGHSLALRTLQNNVLICSISHESGLVKGLVA